MKNGNSFESHSRAALRFNSSESLAYVIEDVFVKPSLHHEFAARGLYLYLYTEKQVDIIPPDTNNLGAMLNGHDPLENYNAGVAQSHKGHDLYRHNYPLSSRKIGAAEYNDRTKGFSLMFRLAIGDYEKKTLLAPPFNNANASAMYVTADIDERLLIPGLDRVEGAHRLGEALGMGHKMVQERGYLPDSYYVTKPTAIIIPPHYPPSEAK
ncbi:MAG TPA: hypothetical protein VF281_00500 [Candidatus Saccharimonadales bacterium]